MATPELLHALEDTCRTSLRRCWAAAPPYLEPLRAACAGTSKAPALYNPYQPYSSGPCQDDRDGVIPANATVQSAVATRRDSSVFTADVNQVSNEGCRPPNYQINFQEVSALGWRPQQSEAGHLWGTENKGFGEGSLLQAPHWSGMGHSRFSIWGRGTDEGTVNEPPLLHSLSQTLVCPGSAGRTMPHAEQQWLQPSTLFHHSAADTCPYKESLEQWQRTPLFSSDTPAGRLADLLHPSGPELYGVGPSLEGLTEQLQPISLKYETAPVTNMVTSSPLPSAAGVNVTREDLNSLAVQGEGEDLGTGGGMESKGGGTRAIEKCNFSLLSALGAECNGGAMNKKKLRRLLSNRASAKRSRQRRRDRLQELEIHAASLKEEHASLLSKLEAVEACLQGCEEENKVLNQEILRLRRRGNVEHIGC